MSAPDQSVQQQDPHEITAEDPLPLFDAWFEQAKQSEPNDPNAAALATATAAGIPSVRMVLIKPRPVAPGTIRTIGDAFCFFTNAGSQKGVQLAENPKAALCFHWKSLRRQVRVEGHITELAPSEVDTYFHSRSRKSQIGAAVSDQSRILASRDELERKARSFAETHPGEIPRPAYWRGFELQPNRIEFWIDGPDRLHDRFLFTPGGSGWERARLYP